MFIVFSIGTFRSKIRVDCKLATLAEEVFITHQGTKRLTEKLILLEGKLQQIVVPAVNR